MQLETPKIDFKLAKHLQGPAQIDFIGFKLTTNMTIRPVMDLLNNLIQFDIIRIPKSSIKSKLKTQYEQYLNTMSNNAKPQNKVPAVSNSKFQSQESSVKIDSFLNQRINQNNLSTAKLVNMTKPNPKGNEADNSDLVLNASSKYSFDYFYKRGEDIAYKEASKYVSNSRPHKYKQPSNKLKIRNENKSNKHIKGSKSTNNHSQKTKVIKKNKDIRLETDSESYKKSYNDQYRRVKLDEQISILSNSSVINKKSVMKSKLSQMASHRQNSFSQNLQPTQPNEDIEVKGMLLGDRKGSGFLEAYTRKVKRYAGGISDEKESSFHKITQANQKQNQHQKQPINKTNTPRSNYSTKNPENIIDTYQRRPRLYTNSQKQYPSTSTNTNSNINTNINSQSILNQPKMLPNGQNQAKSSSSFVNPQSLISKKQAFYRHRYQ